LDRLPHTVRILCIHFRPQWHSPRQLWRQRGIHLHICYRLYSIPYLLGLAWEDMPS